MSVASHHYFTPDECSPISADPNVPTIPEFFDSKDIFITGASGFMGKVLVEKLLRSCPKIKQIFILIREKKGKNIYERLEMIKNVPLFDTLKDSNPEALNKIVPLNGDVSLVKFGLSEADFERMKNVSVIFHVAASVRFDDDLKYATLLNTRGTREVMRFAESLKNIKVVLHTSTTYSNPDRHVIDEEIYSPYADWEDTIRIAENLDETILDILTPKYMSFMPNTYTFTKNLGEQIVNDYKSKIPLVLYRPSIVISSMKDPIPGWLDNFNGPVGLLVGCGIGIMRTMYCDPDNIADFTPVDVAIKGMIVAVWKRGTENMNENVSLPIYNCSTSNVRFATMEKIIQVGKEISNEVPLDRVLWAPGGGMTSSRLLNFIRVILYHIIPAMIIDQMIKFSGNKPFLANLQRKIYTANCALEYFILNNWEFRNKNFMALCNFIKLEDNKDFYYRDFIEFDMVHYFRNCVLGARRYLLKEKDENLPKARIRLQRMQKLDAVVKICFVSILFYVFFIKFGYLHSISQLLSGHTDIQKKL